MQDRALRSFHGHTFIGYPPAPDRDLREEEERTVRGVFLGPEVVEDLEEDRTVVERTGPGAMTLVGDEEDGAVFTADMLQELRRRLREAEAREAEAREASGVRLRPAPDDHALEDELDIDVEIEVDDVAARAPLTALEVALAPNSDSNFYAGFDDERPEGVFLATYSRLSVGAPVSLDVHLPAGCRFRTVAVVEWVRPPEAAAPGVPAGVGLRMGELDEAARRLVRSFARQRKPLFYEA